MIKRSICSLWPLKKTSSAASLTSHKCLVAGLNTVRSKLWGRVLPAWLSPKLPSVKHSCVVYLCFHAVFLKQCHYTAVLIAETSESHSVSLCFVSPVCVCVRLSPPLIPSPPSPSVPRLFIQQWDLAVVTVVAAHLAVSRVEVGGVGEGRRERVIVRGGVGVAGRGKQRLGIGLGGRRRGVVVLILAWGGSAAVA